MNSRYRIYAAVGLAGAFLLSGGFLVLGRGEASTSTVTPVIKPLHAKKRSARPHPLVKPKAVRKQNPTRRASVRRTQPTDGMPEALSAALATHSVAVVALVAPDAVVDELAYEEARAGARAAGVGFAPISVANNDDVQALTTLLGSSASANDRLLDAPAVLVFRRPQQLFVRFNGFIDADTVAQAALNAASETS